MASITITIDDITNPMMPAEPGEMADALHNIAGIIEAAIDNAFSTEYVEHGSVDVQIDIEEGEDG